MRIIKVYPYRTARVSSNVILPREFLSSVYDLLDNRQRDNHIVVEVVDSDNTRWYIMFTDFICIIGRDNSLILGDY